MGEAKRRRDLGLGPKHNTTIKEVWNKWVNRCPKLSEMNSKNNSRRSMAKYCQKCHNAEPCHLVDK